MVIYVKIIMVTNNFFLKKNQHTKQIIGKMEEHEATQFAQCQEQKPVPKYGW